MKQLAAIALIAFLAAADAQAQGSLPTNQFAVLTREHTDGLCVIYDAHKSQPLSLVAWQREAELDLPTNQVILVASEQTRVTLPAGTPFGDAGAPFWILPQSQNPNLLYLGINVGRVPAGVFNGPIAIQLTRFEGSGYFIVWQATAPGQYNIRINTRDGLSAADGFQPLVGAHEHFNWGFSSTGVFCATFQAVGQRIGESTNITSLESTFVFHVPPLPPATNFAKWQRHFWPPGFNPAIIATNANPDGDLFNNLREYAFALSPTNANPLSSAPCFSFVTNGPQRFGALTFTRWLPALDLDYAVEAASTLPGGWLRLTNILSAVPDTYGTRERVTIRDFAPATNRARVHQLRLNLR